MNSVINNSTMCSGNNYSTNVSGTTNTHVSGRTNVSVNPMHKVQVVVTLLWCPQPQGYGDPHKGYVTPNKNILSENHVIC